MMKYKNRKRRLNKEQRDLLNGFYLFLKGRRYSTNTISAYVHLAADMIEALGPVTPEAITREVVETYISRVFEPSGYSISTQRQLISSLKLFKVYHPESGYEALELIRPKRSKHLPVILSKHEVIELIRCTRNIKHRTIIGLLYSAGLRISELLELRISDINIERRQIHIRQSKGRKDRYVVLSDGILPMLRNYFVTYRPDDYVFEGAKGGPYSPTSVRKFLARSCKSAKIRKPVTPHTLRHSYATHLLEQGVNLRHIQTLLGHSRPETTMIYTHVMKKDLMEIRSPLDTILLELHRKPDKRNENILLSGDDI